MKKIMYILALISLFSLAACEDMKMDKNVIQQITVQ